MVEPGGNAGSNKIMSSTSKPKFRPEPVISIVLLLLCFIVGGAQSQLNLTQFMSHDALVGSNVELQCTVTDKGDYNLFWFFDPDTGGDGHLIGDGDFGAKYSLPRFSIVSDAENGHYNLKISKVRFTDAGLYTCTLAESGLSASAGRLTVLQPTPPPSGPVCGLKTLSYKEGEYINGSCSASPGGITPSTLQWFDGRDISVTRSQKDQSNLLRQAHARDDGVNYKCRETHRALKTPRDCVTGKLEVLHKPLVTFLPADKTAELRSNATLTCRTTSNPVVQEVRLFVNDSRVYVNSSALSSVDSRFLLTEQSTAKGINLLFTIHGVEEADYFLLILCQAWNEEGERNQTTMFKESESYGGGSDRLLFILGVDIAALAGVVILVAMILTCKPVCATLCGSCCRKRNN